MVQMDFNCSALSEAVASAYWNKKQVTLHTLVVYWRRQGADTIHHKSLVYVSPVEKHHPTMVFAIIKRFFLTDLKEVVGDMVVTRIHYITESGFTIS